MVSDILASSSSLASCRMDFKLADVRTTACVLAERRRCNKQMKGGTHSHIYMLPCLASYLLLVAIILLTQTTLPATLGRTHASCIAPSKQGASECLEYVARS